MVSAVEIGSPSNNGQNVIDLSIPYVVEATIRGTADLLFHRWNVDAVAAKASAAKGSKAKKSDDVESYVYRTENREIALPGEYFRQSVILAAKYKQDPRSPRKSAMDLFKAGIVCQTNLAGLGTDKWDYEDRRRVQVQRAGITRTRPAIKAGWEVTVQFAVLIPEYINPDLLHEVLANAGRLVGVGDFRPTFGRFAVARFETLKLEI